MVNAYLSVIDHGITINWEHGPTLHKILAQVRYRLAEDGAVQNLRVGASQRCAERMNDRDNFDGDAADSVANTDADANTTADGDIALVAPGDMDADSDIDCFAASNGDLSAQWLWQMQEDGWLATLIVRNIGTEAVWLDAIDIIRIDAQTGLFNLGAPITDWQIESEPGRLRVWPHQSDRGIPMAVNFQAVDAAQSVIMSLNQVDGRFATFTAHMPQDNTMLAPNGALATSSVRIWATDLIA